MMSDPFRFDDAAYVLGALDPAERDAFEAHLLSCEECRARVAELADVPRSLTGVTLGDLEAPGAGVDPGPVPDTLLPRLVRAADRRRTRTRWLTAAAAGVAAAVAVVLTLLLTGTAGSPGAGIPAAGRAQAMHALVATPVHADVALTAETWGTRVTLHCRYDTAAGTAFEYDMTLHARNGDSYPLGGWRITGGEDITYVAGAPIPKAQIARIDVTTPDGTPILRLRT